MTPATARVRPPRRERFSSHRLAGFSLAELLVAVSFVGVFAAMIYGFTASCLRSVRLQQARSDAQDTAHLTLEWMATDIRQAGFDPAGFDESGITSAEETRLQVHADFNGDGDFDDSSERVTYAADAERGTLTRASGASSPQPLINHLKPDSLRFTYLDASGGVLDPGGGTLDVADRNAIRRVDIAFTIAVPSPDPHLREPIRVDAATSVALRNVPTADP